MKMLPAAFYSRHNVDLIESQSVRCHGLPLRVISSKHVLQAKHYEPMFIGIYTLYRYRCYQNKANLVAVQLKTGLTAWCGLKWSKVAKRSSKLLCNICGTAYENLGQKSHKQQISDSRCQDVTVETLKISGTATD